jgi:predicted nucleic acid-binding protein
MSYLIDTNVISEPRRKRPDQNVLSWFAGIDDSEAYISAITIGEIKKGAEKRESAKERSDLFRFLDQMRSRFAGRILPLTEETFVVWGKLIADFEKRGKPRPAIDSLLEATALEHDLVLVTRNIKNFKDSQATILNPWEN